MKDELGGWELVPLTVELPDGELQLLQPIDGAEIPDDGPVEWAPLAPYWSILWRSGVALAGALADVPPRGLRIVELGCGLAVPSLAAARAGAEVLATDGDEYALELAERNARSNGVRIETEIAELNTAPGELLEKAPFDLALVADLLYERQSVAVLADLLPQLAPEVWIADPGRPAGAVFFEQAQGHWEMETAAHGVIEIHRLRLRDRADLA